MAATSQAPLYRTPPNSEIHLYNAQRMSPMNSASGTPAELSPTSPRDVPGLPYLPFQTRQLHHPKSPLYVPAVLRPTERPTKSPLAPLTPPRSVSSSFGSLHSEDADGILSRRSTGDQPKKLGRVVEDDRIDEGFGKVTGLPSREHWKRVLHVGWRKLAARLSIVFVFSIPWYSKIFTSAFRVP
ncbi:MAG: hypothetical protein M1835_002236 [Candelina submexicana]|nr:MAG: hypothetical protein M1835_002236 [Candelina submexicana]